MTGELKANIRTLLDGNTIAYHPELARIGGSVTAGIFLSQLLYWTDRGKLVDGWIWKTQEEWTEETALSKSEQTTARRYLRERGLLEERYGGIPRRLYYRLNMEQLLKLLSEGKEQGNVPAISDESDMPDSEEVDYSGPENPPAISEITRDYPEIVAPGGKTTDEAPVEQENAETIREFTALFGEGQGSTLSVGSWQERMRGRPWLAWHPDNVHPQAGIGAESLQHVGWLVEEVTGLRPVDGEWKGWIKGCVALYQAAKGEWSILDHGIRKVWSREEKYRPGHIRGFVDEVRKASSAKPEAIGW